ncbi:MAG: M1 family metallopeptidase [Gemmatimonadales bacterium]
MPILLALAVLQQTPAAAGPTPYWQQRVVYQISARLDEPTYTLSGDERVKYINHSPDTLRTISFHLYLNSFRPGSRWSDADSAERRRRFNDLKDPDYGFNHVRNVKIDGMPVNAFWPFGRDSTVVRFTLPRALPPGDSLDVTLDWDARPSIPPRRQGRRGRSYDFAQWYPKVVVYDKYGWEEHALYPAGEFYGEFGDFFVKLDVPQDQVVGATGVPVCGDPGWTAANQRPVVRVDRGGDRVAGTDTVFLPVAVLGQPRSCRAHGSDLRADADSAGRKQILWVARDVHNFAMSMSPDYRYEGGEVNGTLVHVLYQPGDEKTWGGGIVVNNTITMLKWMAFIFGPYPWPQMTVVHRIEGGGTEFPMMEMNGSPSLGLNLHEGGHTYLMGILANNEWKEGWMDEGFTSFQTSWFEEIQARNDGAVRGLESNILLSDLNGQSQPVSTQSEKFRDFFTYNNMIYSRGELFLHELHRMVGDSVMLEILHRYFDRWKLHHVDEAAFKAVAEEVSHRDLTTFFAQWLHDVAITDYAVRGARRQRTATGWRTTIDLERKAPGIFPVPVVVLAEHDTAVVAADGVAEHERVVVETKTRPRRVLVDPDVISHDWNMLNNRFTFGRLPWSGADEPTHAYLDTWFSPQVRRDELTLGIMPTVWYNDAGGTTIGFRTHANYLGQFDENTTSVSCGTRNFDVHHSDRSCGFSISLGNPTWWRIPYVSERLTAFRQEGRAGAGLSVERSRAEHLGFGPTHTIGVSLKWLATYDLNYLPARLWDDGGTAEAALWWGVSDTRTGWNLAFSARAAGGVFYRNPGDGITTDKRYDAEAYARPEVTGTATRGIGKNLALRLRGYAAKVFSDDPVLSQRRIFVAGADPYQQMSNAFLRSAGAPLLRDDCWCRWHTPGDGDLRGFDEALSTDGLAALNAEVEGTVFHSRKPLLMRAGVALFGDAGYAGKTAGIGGIGSSPFFPPPDRWLADAGAGIRVEQRIGRTTWTTRLDFPFFVSDPQYAIAQRLNRFALNRVVVSLSPVIP